MVINVPDQFLQKIRHKALLILLSSLIFILSLSSSPVYAQSDNTDTIIEKIPIIEGRVIDFTTRDGLFQVHIINLSRNMATLSGRTGHFHLKAKESDTIYLSHVGFKKRLYRVTADDTVSSEAFTVFLYADTVMLQRFRLLSATREAQFRSDFVARQVVRDTLNPAFEAFMKESYFSAPSQGLVLPGPFTVLYENFNKSARLQRRIERNRELYYENLPEEEKRKVLFHDE